jgi:hypothetical protein
LRFTAFPMLPVQPLLHLSEKDEGEGRKDKESLFEILLC